MIELYEAYKQAGKALSEAIDAEKDTYVEHAAWIKARGDLDKQIRTVAGMLLEVTDKEGGVTYSLRESFLQKGFAVAIYPEREAILNRFLVAVSIWFEHWISKNLDVLTQENTCIGTWAVDDKIYLDVSVVYPDRETAEKVGREKGQLAIFDLAKKEEIYLGQ